MRLSLFPALLALAACVTPALSNEIVGVDWHLVGMEGQEMPWDASLRFEADKVSGKAPCNRFFGTNAATLPAVAITALGSTKMACDDLAAEGVFFEALQAMQRVEVDQGHLYLIGPEGRIMEFVRDPAEPCLSCLARQ
jgi:heat shock protein HslJ